jgi:hypothetical protein
MVVSLFFCIFDQQSITIIKYQTPNHYETFIIVGLHGLDAGGRMGTKHGTDVQIQ